MNYCEDYEFNSFLSRVFLQKIVPIVKNKKVLDLGCGTGEYMGFFGDKSLGIDIAPNNLNKALENNSRVIKMDLNKPKGLNEKFEVVFMSHILEHIENPVNLLRFAYDHLDKQGALIVAVPNETGIFSLRYPYFNKPGNHLYGFSYGNVHELLNYAGFKAPTTFFDYYSVLSKKLGINEVLPFLDYMPKAVRIWFSWAFWFVAEKEDGKR